MEKFSLLADLIRCYIIVQFILLFVCVIGWLYWLIRKIYRRKQARRAEMMRESHFENLYNELFYETQTTSKKSSNQQRKRASRNVRKRGR